MSSDDPTTPDTQRPALARRTLLGAGGLAAVALLAACSSDGDGTGSTSTSPSTTTGSDSDSSSGDTGSGGGESSGSDLATGTPDTTVFTAADFAALGACVLSPQQTEGPYPTEQQIERRDVRESLQGHPLRVGIQVVDEACAPVPGAMVEIWHCDTDGDYSAYSDGGTQDDAGTGTTFLRGSQRANDEGIVEFVTNYPGWYRGRAVHIHTKVHLDDTTVLTSQIFFEDDLNEEIFTAAPYSAHGSPDTTNAQDSIAGDPAAEGTLAHTADDRELSG
ncbi:MAG: dioxygenase family protein, partial [Microthrixaceae bacterium]